MLGNRDEHEKEINVFPHKLVFPQKLDSIVKMYFFLQNMKSYSIVCVLLFSLINKL